MRDSVYVNADVLQVKAGNCRTGPDVFMVLVLLQVLTRAEAVIAIVILLQIARCMMVQP